MAWQRCRHLGNGLVGKALAAAFCCRRRDICFRHTAAPGRRSSRQATPTCNVRARLASMVRKPCSDVQTSPESGPKFRPLWHPSSSICAARRDQRDLFQLGAHRNRSANRRAGRDGVRFRPPAEAGSARTSIAFECSDGGMLVLDHAGDRAERTVGDVPSDGAAELSCRDAPRRASRIGGMAGCRRSRTARRDGRDRH